VSYWLSGIVPQYTKFESAKIVSVAYTSNNTITVKIKNIGTTLMNITEVMVGDDTKSFNGTCTIEKDKETTLIIFNAEWTSGQKYQITILTSIENRYVKKTIAP
jgi:phage-related baseplate assembly protein